MRVSRDCIRATVMAVWLPSVLVLAWCAMVAGPDVLAVAQTSGRMHRSQVRLVPGKARTDTQNSCDLLGWDEDDGYALGV